MAQAKRGIRVRTHGLGRRFGLSGRAWVALACAVAVVVIATVAGLRLAHGDDFSVERGEKAVRMLLRSRRSGRVDWLRPEPVTKALSMPNSDLAQPANCS